MRSLTTILGALALCVLAHAFSDTSPFVLLSTAELAVQTPLDQLQSAAQVTRLAKALLASCPTDHYLVASLPDLHAADLADGANGCGSAPNLCHAADQAEVRTRVTVSEVYGSVLPDELITYIRTCCEHKDVAVAEIILPPLPPIGRALALADNDYATLNSLNAARAGGSYTILYLAGPREPVYVAEFAESGLLELRRDVQPIAQANGTNQTKYSQNLFNAYQFFTPGIYLGLIVAFILLFVLTLGLTALSQLEVSYAAFDRDISQKSAKKVQ